MRIMMMKITGAIALMLMFTAFCCDAHAEQELEQQPEQKQTLEEEIQTLFDEHVDALKQGNFNRMGTQVHPEEALEYKQQFLKLANMALEQGEFGKFARVFPWVNSIKQIEQTEPGEIFAKMMKATIGADIGFLVAVKRAEIDLLGHIKEGEGDEMQIHLLYRMLLKVNGNEVETIEVISLRRAEDGLLYLRVEAKSKAVLNSLLKHYEKRR